MLRKQFVGAVLIYITFVSFRTCFSSRSLTWKLIVQITVPSMASVFNEYALKSQYDTSIYLQVIYFDQVQFYFMQSQGNDLRILFCYNSFCLQ